MNSLLRFGVCLVLATACFVWLHAPACEEPFLPLQLEGCPP